MAKKKELLLNVLEIIKKILNHYIVKNILILIILGIFALWGTLAVLRHYTHHGMAIPVPDVVGLPLEDATNIILSQKMRWQLSDSVYVSSFRPGAVVNQSPEPGSLAKTNRNVFLVVNAISPEKVRMPNVVGVSLRQARTILEQRGLTLGRVTYVPDFAKDYVLKQLYRGEEVEAGKEIVKGSAIVLVLGDGLGKIEFDDDIDENVVEE